MAGFFYNKRILVTGVCGTIGLALIKRLLDVKYCNPKVVIGLDNNENDIFFLEELESEMLKICAILWERIKNSKVKARTLTLKYKYSDFEQHTRRTTIPNYFSNKDNIVFESKLLLKTGGGFDKGIRLLGLTVSNFLDDKDNFPVQLTLDF